jgi:hypothetical protein
MIIGAALSGASASLRPHSSRIATLVEMAIGDPDAPFIGRRALLGKHRARRFRRFIRRHISPNNVLVAVGKSLGARNMVRDVLNELGPDLEDYGKVLLLTVDPCWPTWRDWAPNLNGAVLQLDAPVDHAINVYLEALPSQQAGSRVSRPAENRIVRNCTHSTITTTMAVYSAIHELAIEAREV